MQSPSDKPPSVQLVLVSLLLASAACGSSGSKGPDDGGTPSDDASDDAAPEGDGGSLVELAAALCEAENTHIENCIGLDPELSEDDFLDCSDPGVVLENRCFLGINRADSRAPFLDCVQQRACADDQSDCYALVADEIETTQTRDDYRAACQYKYSTCPGQFATDLCSPGSIPWGLFVDPLLANLTACFHPAYACDEVDACYATALANYTVTNISNTCVP